ncbi:restriction endonuclease [Patescibacteria group bacterium]|nr:restriction endonuclease [Patescibacteria group bacterium]MBU1906923.1 restriction endonuclease [Patescibacteria group bacterium]
MSKPKITRTYNPIHFEDLDPHRFEDLIRELIYDFKDWQNIEATGRSGSDSGFDIRAYEKAEIISTSENENNIEEELIHPMEGNLWMIQGKREKEIGPKKIKSILSDVDAKNPPYGYILAASANFSKDSYDIFRKELREKGVMEFYLWGRAELEDMLHLPKNDRILFTFFGISLVSKRKSKTTEIRSAVSIKNKLFRTVGSGHQFHQSVLVRDLKDINYPYKSEYKDFHEKPRWKEYIAFSHHPLGLWCHNHEYFAYIDTEKKEWDFTKEIDMIHLQREHEDEERKKASEKRELVVDFWDFLPRINKGNFIIDCLIKYSDIALVDDKGDVYCNFPHLYVDFLGEMGPFSGCRNFLKINGEEIELTDEYKRVNIFPKTFKKGKFSKIYTDKKIIFNDDSKKKFNEYQLDTLYETSNKYSFLKPKDVILIDDQETDENYIQITHIYKAKVKDHLSYSVEPWKTKNNIQVQLGKEYDENEEIYIYEFKKVYKWQLERK